MALREVLLGPIYIARALLTTFKHNTRPIVTIEYPERQKAVPPRERGKHILALIARYFVAIPVLFYSFEQFLRGDHVPGVPLEPLTPAWIPGHAVWTYLAAAVYAVAGILLLVGKKTRAAATWLGLTVLFVVLVVYVPIGVVERASLDKGLNYLAETLMFCGTVLLLAGTMPREASRRESSADQWPHETRIPKVVG